MVLGGLRRCEVLGLRLEDVNAGERQVFVADGKGGRQRVVPLSARFFGSLGDYLEQERPPVSTTKQVFVVLKGVRRGEPLSAAGLWGVNEFVYGRCVTGRLRTGHGWRGGARQRGGTRCEKPTSRACSVTTVWCGRASRLPRTTGWI